MTLFSRLPRLLAAAGLASAASLQAAPTHVVATYLNSPSDRAAALTIATDGTVGSSDAETFEVFGYPYQYAGLVYQEAQGSGQATRFDSIRLDTVTGYEPSDVPRVYLLRYNSDPNTANPVADDRYARLPVVPVRIEANSAGQPAYVFDLSGLSANERTGYGFAIVGVTSGPPLQVSELSATTASVADSGVIKPQPFLVDWNNGHRYGLTTLRGDWNQAEAEAVAAGGHLLTLNSAQENDFINGSFGYTEQLYIGLRQNLSSPSYSEPAGGFEWVSGEPVTYTNWHNASFGGNEPNHAFGAGEDYVSRGYFQTPSATWGDIKKEGYPETSDFRGLVEVPSAGSSRNSYLWNVSAKANIFDAGLGAATQGGVLPPVIDTAGLDGQVVTFPQIVGMISTNATVSGPDGSHVAGQSTDLNGVGTISGYKNLNNTPAIVGVFLGASLPAQRPATLDFSRAALGEDFPALAPALGQVFFIGDGYESASGGQQKFVVPAGATRLFIGMTDGTNNGVLYHGDPNTYGDNTGSVTVRASIAPATLPFITNPRFPLAGGQLQILGGSGSGYNVSVVSGTLPAGIAVSINGLVTGFAANGPYNFTLRITDPFNASADFNYTGKVQNPVQPDGSLLAWWPGDSAVGDIAGSNHAAEAFGGQNYEAGKIGHAFSFNGINQSLTTPVATDVLNRVPLTIEGWVRPEAHSSGSINDPLPPNVISNDRVNFGGHGFGVHIYPDGSKLNIGVQGVEADFRNIPNVTFLPDVWVHIAVVYSPGMARTYVNGVLRDTFTYTQAALEGNSVVRIGRHNDDAGYGTRRFFKGRIDELSLYGRALSAGDVSAIYGAGSSGKAHFDAGRQFSFTNPQDADGVWTYGEINSGAIDTSTFALFDTIAYDGPELGGWTSPSSGSVVVNTTDISIGRGSPIRITSPRMVQMHPSTGGSGKPAVLRWTAPASGVYAVAGTFTDTDSDNSHSRAVKVYHNTTSKFSANVSGFMGNGASTTHQINAVQGDTVDFIVGEGTDGWDYDSTGLIASVVLLTPNAPEITVEDANGSNLVSSSDGYDFGDQGNGYAATRIFTIKNSGAQPLTISGVNVDGGDWGDFAINTTDMLTTIPGGGSTVFSVVFTPGALGERGTTLSIASNDADEGLFSIPLTGNGVVPMPGVIAFESGTGQVLESGGTAHINLVRTGGSTGEVSVFVDSTAGTATDPDDFVAVNGEMVTFENGQTTATVPVTILDDALVDLDENFTLTLSGPQGGATLGTTTSTELTIVNTVDTTAPTLMVNRSWIEKSGTKFAFKLLVDARDNNGVQKVEHRFKINTTTALPTTTPPWTNSAWVRGQPIVITQACSSIVIEMRAVDAAGNVSAIERRIFKAPFPVSTAPNIYPHFQSDTPLTGGAIDCRGLFVKDFNGDGRDDVLQIDRLTGLVKVRRQNTDGTYSSSGFTLAANSINDSAIGDFDGDGRLDIAIVVSNTLNVYHNDGPDGSGVPQFSAMNAAGLATTGLNPVTHVAVGDLTGEGKPEIVLSGTGPGGAARVAILLNNGQFQLGASNYAEGLPGSSSGPVKLGDVNGDGHADAVMIDPTGRKLVLFRNKANGSLGGADDTDAAMRPQATAIAAALVSGVTPQALAVGDITGDGRADVVVTMNSRSHFAGDGPTTDRDRINWQLFDSRRGAATLHANPIRILEESQVSAASAPTRSDVILHDMNEDGFAEIVMTNPFLANTDGLLGGVRAVFFEPELDTTNTLTAYTESDVSYANGIPNPHRLAVGSYAGSAQPSILVANADVKQLDWISYSYTPSTKQYDLLTGASTDSDSNGDLGNNGLFSYGVDVGGVINYTLNYVNNSTEAITAAVIECLLPAQLNLESGDTGYTLVPSGKSKYVRWTLDIPAHSSGVKRFSVRVLSGEEDDIIALKGVFRKSASPKIAITTAMPSVYLLEPLGVSVTTTTDSDSSGNRAHVDENITYNMKVKNYGTGTISGFKLSMGIPGNTSLMAGTSPPNPVLGGTFPKYTSVTWNNLSLAPGASLEYFVRVRVAATAEVGKAIKNITVMVTRADGSSQGYPPIATMIEPPIEITMTSNKNIVRPGEIIRYTLTARNWMTTALTNARVVNELPVGTKLYSAAKNDALDSAIDGRGNFNYTSTQPWMAADLSPTTIPAYERSSRIMNWVFGGFPANASRSVQFEVIVASDIPTFANISGVSTTLEVQNKAFNFVATSSKGSRLFAFKANGGAAANQITATSLDLLSSAVPVRRSLLSSPPVTPPALAMHKRAIADGEIRRAGELITTVINDPADSTSGLVEYRVEYRNKKVKASDPEPGIGQGVVVRDYLPIGMTFNGFIERNDVPVTSFVGGYRFYTAAAVEMPVIGAEGFTDSNGNGFYDSGEPYNDANRNKKYDGVTASLVRIIDFPAGDVPNNGQGNFSYLGKTISKPLSRITSTAGGVLGVKNGLTYTTLIGYMMLADNLHFPVNGSPKEVIVEVTSPAVITQPVGAISSRSGIDNLQSLGIAIPTEITGALGVAISNMKMDFTIPKGIQVALAQLYDLNNQLVQEYARTPADSTRPGGNSFTIGAADKAGVRTLSIPMGSLTSAFPVIKLALDPATKSVLQNTSGQTKAPVILNGKITGQYSKTSTAVLRASRKGGLSAPPPTPLQMTASPINMAVQVRTDTAKDSKIFVGRCAPASVKRGDTFKYTIFVGNLTSVWLGFGKIEMNVPAGCDFVSASDYAYNSLGTAGDDVGRTQFTSKYAASRNGAKVTWQIGTFAPAEGGSVTLTLKVRDDFTGSRIDDNTCGFDVVNAGGKSAGPMGIVVRSGNENTQAADIVPNLVQGLGVEYNEKVRNALAQSFTFNSDSYLVNCGGADILQITNGTAVIQLMSGAKSRVLVIGPPDKVQAAGLRLINDNDPRVRIAAGPGDNNGVTLSKLPNLSPGAIKNAADLLGDLASPTFSLVGNDGASLVAAGGGNLVAAGAGNLVGQDGSTIEGAAVIKPDGIEVPVDPLVAAGAGNLVGQDGSTLVAAGGGNLVAAGGGNLVAAGAGNLVGQDGGTITVSGVRSLKSVGAAGDPTGILNAGAGSLVGQDGSIVITAGSTFLYSTHTGNVILAGDGIILFPNKL